jgi:hypothetical protein
MRALLQRRAVNGDDYVFEGRLATCGADRVALKTCAPSMSVPGQVASTSLTACRHQALAAVSPPNGASQNAWVYICPQTTTSMYQLIDMHLGS